MSDKMTEKEYVPFGVEVYVSNRENSMRFYRDVLGFKLIRTDETNNFVSFEFNNAVFMIEEKSEWVKPTTGIVLRFIVPDIKSYYDEVLKRGGVPYKPIEIKSYGLTRFYVKDPDGYQLKFGSK